MTAPRRSYLILGAGVTGLTLAERLSRSGASVTVLEKSDALGGLAGSIDHGGFFFDYGPHEFLTENPVLIEYLRETLGQLLLQIEKKASHFYLGKFINYPLKVHDILYRIPLRISLSCFTGFAWAKLRTLLGTPREDSFEQWVLNRFGRGLYNLYFGPYTEKVWGVHPTQLAAITAAQRIAVQSLWEVAYRTVTQSIGRTPAHEFAHSPYWKTFFYARGGIGRLSENLARLAVERGGAVLCSSPVRGIVTTGNRVTAVQTDARTFRAGSDFDHVIVTIPINNFVRMIEEVPENVREKAETLRFRAITFAFLILNRPQLSPYHWIYFPDVNLIFQRLTEFKGFYPADCPADRTSIGLELSCDFHDATWNMSDDEAIARSTADLVRLGLIGSPNEVADGIVRRVHHAYPLQRIGFEKNAAVVHEFLSSFENLDITGRQALFAYINMNECMERALALADRLEAP